MAVFVSNHITERGGSASATSDIEVDGVAGVVRIARARQVAVDQERAGLRRHCREGWRSGHSNVPYLVRHVVGVDLR